MGISDFFNNMKGEILKNALLKQWIQPHQLEWVDFNNMEQLNQLAETIVPELIKKNPMMANLIKQNSTMLWAEKQKEVVEVIDKL
jgi:hypothetical protein